jgi:hypothetical protein
VVFHSKLNDNYVISATTGENAAGLRLSVYNTSSVTAQRFDIIHGAGVARIVSHISYANTGTWRSVQVKDGHVSTPIPSGTVLNQRIPYSTPDEKAHQYWVFENSTHPAASSHPLIPESYGYTVDSGRHCDIDFGSTFPAAWRSEFEEAMASWNNVNGNIFRKDSLINLQDVSLKYLNESPPNGHSGAAAVTRQFNIGSSEIKFFIPVMSLYDDYALQRKRIFTHELGHLLGISEGSYVYDLMYGYEPGWYEGSALSINDRLFYQTAASHFNY